jgi:hypothetical protein
VSRLPSEDIDWTLLQLTLDGTIQSEERLTNIILGHQGGERERERERMKNEER